MPLTPTWCSTIYWIAFFPFAFYALSLSHRFYVFLLHFFPQQNRVVERTEKRLNFRFCSGCLLWSVANRDEWLFWFSGQLEWTLSWKVNGQSKNRRKKKQKNYTNLHLTHSMSPEISLFFRVAFLLSLLTLIGRWFQSDKIRSLFSIHKSPRAKKKMKRKQ